MFDVSFFSLIFSSIKEIFFSLFGVISPFVVNYAWLLGVVFCFYVFFTTVKPVRSFGSRVVSGDVGEGKTRGTQMLIYDKFGKDDFIISNNARPRVDLCFSSKEHCYNLISGLYDWFIHGDRSVIQGNICLLIDEAHVYFDQYSHTNKVLMEQLRMILTQCRKRRLSIFFITQRLRFLNLHIREMSEETTIYREGFFAPKSLTIQNSNDILDIAKQLGFEIETTQDYIEKSMTERTEWRMAYVIRKFTKRIKYYQKLGQNTLDIIGAGTDCDFYDAEKFNEIFRKKRPEKEEYSLKFFVENVRIKLREKRDGKKKRGDDGGDATPLSFVSHKLADSEKKSETDSGQTSAGAGNFPDITINFPILYH